MNNSSQCFTIQDSKSEESKIKEILLKFSTRDQLREELYNGRNKKSGWKKLVEQALEVFILREEEKEKELDLHYLHSENARNITNYKLDKIVETGGAGYKVLAGYDENDVRYNYVRYIIITGRGNHSKGGKKVLYYEVKELLKERKWHFKDAGKGGRLVARIPI